MKSMKRLSMVLLPIIVLLNSACAATYNNPVQNFRESDLAGTWEAHYENLRVDKIIIDSNGTYKQIYEETKTKYIFDTSWKKWWVENSKDGRKYIHLEGARYYLDRVDEAERDGMGDLCPPEFLTCGWDKRPRFFYNPYTHESLEMVGELILIVLVDSSGKLILHHMWTSGDRGFAIIGGNEEIFHREAGSP